MPAKKVVDMDEKRIQRHKSVTQKRDELIELIPDDTEMTVTIEAWGTWLTIPVPFQQVKALLKDKKFVTRGVIEVRGIKVGVDIQKLE
jgi:hypothetical protein